MGRAAVVDALCRILEDGGFGVHDRLKQALLSSAGLGALLRGRPKKEEEEEDSEDAEEWDQLALFQ